jgi:integrase
LREGKLLQATKRIPTFEEFAKGWWSFDTCPYLKSRMVRRKISRSYAELGRTAVNNQLLPTFGKLRLDAITPVDIDNWMVGMIEQGYKSATVNGYYKFFRTMMAFAVRRKIILEDPCVDVELLSQDDEHKITILTPDEVSRIFPADWKTVWRNYALYCINKLASVTGMRMGELLGLRGEHIFADHIEIVGQYGRHGYSHETKTHKPRAVPVPSSVKAELDKLIELNAGGYIFSYNGGETPIDRKAVGASLWEALAAIGIDENERKERGLCFHAWRHFFNTRLVSANVSASVVRSAIGHSSERMTDHYTHIALYDMDELRAVQEGVISGDGAVTADCKKGVVRGFEKPVGRKRGRPRKVVALE